MPIFIQILSLDRRINHHSSFQKSMLPLAEESSCLTHMSQSIQAPLQPIKLPEILKSESKNRGIIIAFLIIGIWASSLVFLLSLNISKVNFLWLMPVILWQAFLYTGLFITAHDAMHGSVFTQNHKINNLVGALAVFLYGLFDYQQLLKKHWSHHHHPASELDPDFHDGKHKNFFAWYFHFMTNYWSWTRLIGLMITFNVISYTIHIPEKNLTLFWVLPSILSSVQLFYFGSFLPHREPEGGHTSIHCAQSSQLPVFWSFITCYHFGYHKEHHEYPHVPWWNLPVIYRMQREIS